MASTEVDILIVGAGPVGLFLANECVRRGLRWRLVEEHAALSEHSKALAIFPRTMEIFDMAGVVGPVLEKANCVTEVSVMRHGNRIAHMRFAPEASPYPFIAMVPQSVTERVLADELGRKGGAVEFETKFVAATEHNLGVNVKLEHRGETEEARAAFVVGCDGARSTVRRMLNLPFEGGEYEDTFMLADVETNDALPVDEMQLCPSEAGPVAIFPINATRRRIVAAIERESDEYESASHPETSGDAPTLEVVRRVMAQRAPIGMEVRALYWSSYFRIHHRQVARMRVGRFFVAGDAAHIHSPFGGQGMNLGLHDVWNLGWKLDFALRGHGGEELLDSYGAERLPVIKQVIETTDLLTRAMATPSRLAQMLRDAVIPMVSRLAPFQHAFVQRLAELDVAYAGSPIVEGAGERYFDDSLRGGDGIGSRFLLVVDSYAEAAIRESAEHLAGTFRDIVELRLQPRHDITLVRPDGYVAFSAHNRGGVAALAAVGRLLKRQTKLSLQYVTGPRTAA